MNTTKKVLILGGGFAGVEAAIYLRKKKMDVTLVSDRDYFYIYPTSIWIPTGEKEFSEMCVPLDELQQAHGFDLIVDEVTRISAETGEVELAHAGVMHYDYLIIAMGAGKMKPKGVEHTMSICGAPEESISIKKAIDRLVIKGGGKIAMGFGGNPKDTSAVRGGPAFEVLFNVHNMLKKKKIRDKFELTFFAPMDKPGARMGDQALNMMDVFFDRLNINTHFGKKFKQFTPDGITFEDDSTLESDFTMFIPAGDGHPVIKASDLPLNDAGFVVADDYSQVHGNIAEGTHVFAIGDVAALDGPDWRAKQGHVAEVMARNVAFNIEQMEKGSAKRKGYQEHLNILCVMDSGNGAAFVYRDNKRAFMFPMPLIGHTLKKGWGWYCRNSKLDKIPRLPGM